MKLFRVFAAVLAIGAAAVVTMGQLPVKKVLSLQAAKKIAAAAEAEALKRGSTVVIAVVDDGMRLNIAGVRP